MAEGKAHTGGYFCILLRENWRWLAGREERGGEVGRGWVTARVEV